jgi:hypothetical protein
MIESLTRVSREAWRKLQHVSPSRRAQTDNYFAWRVSERFLHLRRRFLRDDKASAPLDRPIFIVGTMRGGTTLLARCLAEHARVNLVNYELTPQWIDLAGLEMSVTGLATATRCPPWSAEDATPARCARVREGFQRLDNGRGGPRARFLNKNPHLWNKLPFLHAVFPDAHLVVAARDLRSTTASLLRLFDMQNKTRGSRFHLPEDARQCWSVIPSSRRAAVDPARTFPGGRVSVLADYWLRAYETIEQTSDVFNVVTLVRHRDLIADAASTLSKLQADLELPHASIEPPEALDAGRNNRWGAILTPAEHEEVDLFVEANVERIRRLRLADTTL